jgi:hypothetical protein
MDVQKRRPGNEAAFFFVNKVFGGSILVVLSVKKKAGKTCNYH